MDEQARSELLDFLISLEEMKGPMGSRMLGMLVYLSLQSNGSADFGQMADALNVSRPATTRGVQRLVNYGYVTSKVNRDDRRKVTVTITKAGERLVTSEVRKREKRPAVVGNGASATA